MKKLFSRPALPLTVTLLVILLSATAQSLVVLFCLPKGGVYYRGNLIPLIPPLLSAGASVFYLVWSRKKAKAPKETIPLEKPDYSLLLRIPALIPTVAAALLLMRQSTLAPLFGVLILLALLGCIYPLFAALPALRKQKAFLFLFGFGAIAAPILSATAVYFDASMEMNAPLKILLMISTAALPLLPVYELRSLTDGSPSPWLMPARIIYLSAAALSCPTLLVYMTGSYPYLLLAIASVTPLLVSISLIWQILRASSEAPLSTSPGPESPSEPERNDT